MDQRVQIMLYLQIHGHILPFTHDNSSNTTKFYINGTLDATTTSLTKNLAGNSSNLYIGWDGQQGDKFFTGKIDEIRIWDDVRTQTEIQDNMYKELVGNESNLVAYYNFNDGRGTSVLDLTSNNNNGIMTNMDASADWTNSRTLGPQSLATLVFVCSLLLFQDKY